MPKKRVTAWRELSPGAIMGFSNMHFHSLRRQMMQAKKKEKTVQHLDSNRVSC